MSVRSLGTLAVRALLCLIPFAVLALPLLAQADTTVVVNDKTGIFGPMIDHYFGAIVGLIQSGLLWVLTKGSPRWKALAEPIKWGALYLLGVGLTWLSLKFGLGGSVEGNTLTVAAVLGAVPTLASGLIFKIGGHKVPPQPASGSAFRS